MVTHRLVGFTVDPAPPHDAISRATAVPDPSLERLSTRLVEHLPVYLKVLDRAADSYPNIGRVFILFGVNFGLAVPGGMCHPTLDAPRD